MPDPTPEERAEALARQFHETYERLAPEFYYITRDESAVPWENVPKRNRDLMIATAREVLLATESERVELAREVERYRIENDGLLRDCDRFSDALGQIRDKRPNQSFDPWAVEIADEALEGLDRPTRAERAEREVEELRGALRTISPERLEELATWLDIDDARHKRISHEVQDDLRLMAQRSRAALSEPKSEQAESVLAYGGEPSNFIDVQASALRVDSAEESAPPRGTGSSA